MSIEAWQISILVTAAIIVAEFVVSAVLRRKSSLVFRRRLRTVALAALAALTIVVAVIALGPSLADQLASVAAAVAAVVAVGLTYRSYRAQQSNGAHHSPGDHRVGGDEPLR